jgi:hypothetical protein
MLSPRLVFFSIYMAFLFYKPNRREPNANPKPNRSSPDFMVNRSPNKKANDQPFFFFFFLRISTTGMDNQSSSEFPKGEGGGG